MNSLTEYIKWYSDMSFFDIPFSEADNLVLCMLAYYKFDLKKSGGRPAQVRRCVVGNTSSDSFLRAVCGSMRFGHIIVTDYTDVFDKSSSTQFAAMIFRLRDGLHYIAFRGTDNSLVGWREDFMISYMSTPGQRYAVDYLERMIDGEGDYYVGGHSKGGNLALYGCCHLSDEKLRRVKHIYNNDGPGLCPEVSDVGLIERVKLRTTVILPTYCIFGKIFAHKIPDTKIVHSSYEGINEHDILSWQTDCGQLARADDFEQESLWINRVADLWIKDISTDERQRLVDSLFDSFEKGGAVTRDDLMSVGIDGVEELVAGMVESDSLKTAAKIPEKMVFGDFFYRLSSGKLAKFINANELIEGLIFLAAGILTLAIHKSAVEIIAVIIAGGAVAFQLAYTVKRLFQSHWNFEKERARVYILLTMIALFILLLVKDQALYIIGSGLAGIWLLVIANKCFFSVKGVKTRDFAFYKKSVKAAVYLLCGVAVLATPLAAMRWIMLAVGIIMAIDGICTIVYSVIQANDKAADRYSNIKGKVRHKKQ